MSLTPVFYRITITAMSQAPNGTGFVDPKVPQHYLALDNTSTFQHLPSDLAHATDKARANYRWKQLLGKLSEAISPTQILDIQTPGADENNAPTSVSFTVTYDRPHYLVTNDELNAGQQLTGELAIKRWVARALTSDYNTNVCILDPTPLSAPAKAGPASASRGETITQIKVGAIAGSVSAAEAKITVVKLAFT